jgi:hypothetical protein
MDARDWQRCVGESEAAELRLDRCGGAAFSQGEQSAQMSALCKT